jgi:hypothetical protein
MNKNIVSIETMHADHEHWLSEYARWRAENERWQAEHEAAITCLVELQNIVRRHEECLEEHTHSFAVIENAVAAHERELSRQRIGTNDEPPDVLATRHQEEAARFQRQQDAHERIKNHHQAVMAQLQALETSTIAAM